MFRNILDDFLVPAGSGGLNCSDRQDILDAHSTAQQNVTLGRVPSQPAATNMLEIISDTKMADVRGCAERERDRDRERACSCKGKRGDEKTAMVRRAVSQGFITFAD